MTPPYRLVSRDHRSADTVVEVAGTAIGGGGIITIAGPCAVESHESLVRTIGDLHAAGVRLIRAGAFKPRTSPYAFRGLGEAGLRILDDVRKQFGVGVVTEVLEPSQVQPASQHADVLQVGTRNMQNFALLEAVGASSRPVLLKRGMSATIEELLCAAEYVVAAGNPQVILCERGLRSFDPSTRAVCDIAAVPLLKRLTHLPVIVDPSHATGHRDLVPPVALAAVAAGADGLLVEAHHDPAHSLVDGAQTISTGELAGLLDQVDAVADAVGRRHRPRVRSTANARCTPASAHPAA